MKSGGGIVDHLLCLHFIGYVTLLGGGGEGGGWREVGGEGGDN